LVKLSFPRLPGAPSPAADTAIQPQIPATDIDLRQYACPLRCNSESRSRLRGWSRNIEGIARVPALSA
jgi:hypothetical protein